MSFFEQNLKCIQETRTKLYQQILSYDSGKATKHNLEVQSIASKDGNAVVIIKKNGQEYRFNSIYRPIEEAVKWASQFRFESLGIVVSMFGLGNGIFLRELIQQKREKDTILVYEPSAEVFFHVLEHYDITDIIRNDKILITVEGINQKDYADVIALCIHWTNVKSQIVCMHPQYEKVFLESCKWFLTIINENNNRTFINRNTEAFFGRDIIENTIKNLKFVQNANTVLEFIDEFPDDVPAIIVSAGPSLDRNIEELKRAKGKAVIVATDTAMRFLYEHGIEPDFFVTLDAMKPESYVNDPRYMEVPLFCKIESNWRILHKHKAKKIFYSSQAYLEQIYKKLGYTISNYTSGGSVATGAFSVCAALRFKTIVFIGQDLAYAGDRTHAGTLTDRILGEEEGVRYVEGVDGTMVKTRHDWYMYLQWFENAIEEVKDTIEVIDATEGGAKIAGAKIMKLSEVIDQFCKNEIDCAKIVSNKANTLSQEEISKFTKYMTDSVEEQRYIQLKAKEAVKLCDEILQELRLKNEITERVIKKSKKIESINHYIEGCLSYFLVDEYISDMSMQTLSDLYQFTQDAKVDRENTYLRAKSFYEAIAGATNGIQPLLEEALEDFSNLECRPSNKKKKIVLIVQARMGSTRLNGKVMRKLFGKTILAHDIERLQQVKQVDEIVIATTVNERDDIIVKEAERLGVKVTRGSEDNVLSRYYSAAKDHRADIVIRATSDCPLIDPQIIDEVITYYTNNNFDIATNAGIDYSTRTYPRGLDIEIFSCDKLREAYQYAKEIYQREHVTPYLYEKGSVGYYVNEMNYSHYRWTLDTEEDWDLISKIYEGLYRGEHDFYFKDILDFMKKYPELEKINQNVEQKKVK